MQNLPGTYALILKSFFDQLLEIGKLGRFPVPSGFYVYAGSAFGPGGLKARIVHHKRISARPHWHIDFLRAHLQLNEIWYTYDCGHREHQWADVLACARRATVPIPGFGASDCGCKSHLFWFSSKPSVRSFRNRLQTGIHNHEKVFIKEFTN
jgi:Uri superfamily endonuclease